MKWPEYPLIFVVSFTIAYIAIRYLASILGDGNV